MAKIPYMIGFDPDDSSLTSRKKSRMRLKRQEEITDFLNKRKIHNVSSIEGNQSLIDS